MTKLPAVPPSREVDTTEPSNADDNPSLTARVTAKGRELLKGARKLGAAVARDRNYKNLGNLIDSPEPRDTDAAATGGPLDVRDFREAQQRLQGILDLSSRASNNGRGKIDLDSLLVLIAETVHQQANITFELARQNLGESEEYQPLYVRARASIEEMDLLCRDIRAVRNDDSAPASFFDLVQRLSALGGNVQDLVRRLDHASRSRGSATSARARTRG